MTHGFPRSCPPLRLTRAQDSPRSPASVMKAVTGWEASRFTWSPAGGFMKVSHPAQRSLHSPTHTLIPRLESVWDASALGEPPFAVAFLSQNGPILSRRATTCRFKEVFITCQYGKTQQ